METEVGAGIRCHKCADKTGVFDSRPVKDGIWRRRKCHSCGHRFSTYERIDVKKSEHEEGPKSLLAVIKTLQDTREASIQAENMLSAIAGYLEEGSR